MMIGTHEWTPNERVPINRSPTKGILYPSCMGTFGSLEGVMRHSKGGDDTVGNPHRAQSSIRVVRAYPLIVIRQTAPRRAILGQQYFSQRYPPPLLVAAAVNKGELRQSLLVRQ